MIPQIIRRKDNKMKKYVFIGNLSVLRKECLSTKKNQFTRLKEQCDRYFNMALPIEHPATSTTYIGIAIVNLALMYIISKDTQYLTEAKRFMFTVCNYEKWGNAHLVNVDLSASWILFGLSLAYDWLKTDLSKQERSLVFNKLVLQSSIMYNYKIQNNGKGWPTDYYQNHNWINMTGLACCGYALKNEYPQAQNYIDEAKNNFKKVYSYLADDGSNYEGVVYWRYGGMWLFVYADLLKKQEKINYFEKCNYLKNTFYYRLYQSSAKMDRQLNFGDAHDRYSGHSIAVYYKVASEYNDGYAQRYANIIHDQFLYSEGLNSKVKPGILPEACFELLWYNPNVVEKNLEELPRVRYFADLGLVCIRSSMKQEGKTFAFKCGYPGGKKQWLLGWKEYYDNNMKIMSLSHHHPDNNSYILNDNDSYFAIDDGYNRNIMPYHHNVVMVDNETCEVKNTNDVYMDSIHKIMADDPNYLPSSYHGNMMYFTSDQSLTFFKGETHATYKQSLQMKEVSRFGLTVDLDYIIFIDTLKSNAKHIYESVFNSDTIPNKISANHYRYYNLSNVMDYYAINSHPSVFAQENHEVKSVMTTQEPDNFCFTELKSLRLKNKEKVKNSRFIQVLTLNQEESLKVKIAPKLIRISKNNEYDDYLVLSKNFKNIKTDGKMIYIRVSNHMITKIASIRSSYLMINDKTLYQEKRKGNHIVGEINELFE